MKIIRNILVLLIVSFGTLFLMENDHETVSLIIPFEGRSNPVSVGVFSLFFFLSGILVSVVFSLLSRMGQSLKKGFANRNSQGEPPHGGGPHGHS